MSAQPRTPIHPLRYVDPAEFTPNFAWRGSKKRRGDEVFCEDVSLADAAETFSTPAYIYSQAAIEAAFCELDKGLGALRHTLCFAVKSNGNLTILKYLAKLGSGFDVVSGGELQNLGHLGIPGDKIVFSGVGKSREEIREALRYRSRGSSGRRGLLLFNIESEAELGVLLDESAKQMKLGCEAPSVSIRVNPDVRAGGHPHISTGHHEICGWPPARTSGFTRMETLGASQPSFICFADSSSKTPSSASDSILKSNNPRRPVEPRLRYRSASRISSLDLPTPEKTILSPGIPRWPRFWSSPPDTTSNPLPNFARYLRMVRFPLDFTAKQSVWRSAPRPLSSSQKAASMAAWL